jgi:hypothetical protein
MQKSALDAMRTTLDTNDALLTKSQGRSRTGTDQPLDTALEDCESEKTGPCVWLPTRRCLFSRPARRRVAFLRAVLNSPRMEMPWKRMACVRTPVRAHRPTGNDIRDAWIAAAVLAITITW